MNEDQFVPVTRELIIATKARDRYFDLDAVREPFAQATIDSDGYGRTSEKMNHRVAEGMRSESLRTNAITHAGAPPLDTWTITDEDIEYPKGSQVGQATFYVGDVFDVMAGLPDSSVDLVLTSPPFLALRSYLPADHVDKGREIGSEANPAAFVDTLLALTAEWGRLLAPHGSICIELGDTYASGAHPARTHDESYAQVAKAVAAGRTTAWGAAKFNFDRQERPASGEGWPLAKSLALVPELYRIALAYGINPLTGQESPAGRWRVRNVVRWHRPNPPVGALGDKFRPSTSDLVVACRSASRYFDLDAVREPSRRPEFAKYEPSMNATGPGRAEDGMQRKNRGDPDAGAPPLDTWTIPTHAYPGAHYATWPPQLCVRPIKSMCPERVCRVCGEPSRRIVEKTEDYAAARAAIGNFNTNPDGAGPSGSRSTLSNAAGRDITSAENVTVGWTSCGHDDWRPGLILDCFAGSGTTLAVATGHGRDAVGIDLDARNLELARQRCGMFLEEGVL